MDSITRNVSSYIRKRRINLSGLARDTNIPYPALYASLLDESRDRELRAQELIAISRFLGVNPMDFADEPKGGEKQKKDYKEQSFLWRNFRMSGVRGQFIRAIIFTVYALHLPALRGQQVWLGSMVSALNQRSFVELTRLFGASYLAEGQRALPVPKGLILVTAQPKEFALAMSSIMLLLLLNAFVKPVLRFNSSVILPPPNASSQVKSASCVIVGSFKIVIVWFIIHTSVCYHTAQHMSSS